MPKGRIELISKPVTISSNDVLELTIETLKSHLDLLVKGHVYKGETIFHILVKASVERSTIEDTCNQLENAPHSNTIRYQLNKDLLVDIKVLEEQANKALLEHLPLGFKNKRHKIAIDLVLIPYHGKAYENKDEIKRGKARDGTTHFHCYASVYCIRKDKRITLALTYVKANDTLVEVLERLLARLKESGIKIQCLYLDRGFCQVDCISFLKDRNIPTILPLSVRGRRGGARRLLKTRCSYKTTYTMRSKRYGEATFDVFVVCKYSKGKYGRHGLERFAYVVLGNPSIEIHQVYEEYRLRFGIESSYRLMNSFRARTTSRNPALRLLLVGIAFILLNIWVYLKWVLKEPRKGGRYIHKDSFVLSMLRLFLIEAIKGIYGLSLSISQPPVGSM